MVDEARFRDAERQLWASVGVAPRERRVRLEPWDVEVRVQEVGQGEPLLLIHGGPNAGSTWAPLVPHLEGFCCSIIDRPGTGLSEPIPLTRPDIEPYADRFVAAALDGLGLERAHVVGSSLGGYLALRSAAATPARIDRMVLMGAPPFIEGMGVPAFMRMMMINPLRRVMTAMPPSRRMVRMSLKQMGHGASLAAGKISPELMGWSLSLQRDTDTMRHDGDLIGAAGSRRGFDPTLTLDRALLASVGTPTLLLWGDDDVFGSPAAASAFAASLPSATLVMLPESGHLPWIDDPEGLAHSTTQFLRGTLDRSSA